MVCIRERMGWKEKRETPDYRALTVWLAHRDKRYCICPFGTSGAYPCFSYCLRPCLWVCLVVSLIVATCFVRIYKKNITVKCSFVQIMCCVVGCPCTVALMCRNRVSACCAGRCPCTVALMCRNRVSACCAVGYPCTPVPICRNSLGVHIPVVVFVCCHCRLCVFIVLFCAVDGFCLSYCSVQSIKTVCRIALYSTVDRCFPLWRSARQKQWPFLIVFQTFSDDYHRSVVQHVDIQSTDTFIRLHSFLSVCFGLLFSLKQSAYPSPNFPVLMTQYM